MSDLFDFEPQKDEYAVMGNPINHSKSPMIHQQFALQTEQNLKYEAIHVDIGGFRQAIGNFQASGGKGLNITVPFKQEAFDLSDECSTRADRAMAVNTLKIYKDKIIGDNTDGVGLVNDLKNNLSIDLSNKSVLLMGAGGASRGIISPLLNEQVSSIYIVNRTVDTAQALAELFYEQGEVSSGSYASLENKQFDIIINATSASLQGECPPLPDTVASRDTLCYDMMYGNEATVFMRWAQSQNVDKISDGLGMLVEQAAESFFIWRNVRPDTRAVICSVRKLLSS